MIVYLVKKAFNRNLFITRYLNSIYIQSYDILSVQIIFYKDYTSPIWVSEEFLNNCL